jgi:hypothetical protein
MSPMKILGRNVAQTTGICTVNDTDLEPGSRRIRGFYVEQADEVTFSILGDLVL